VIGYASVGTNDLEKATAFYDALLGKLDRKRIHSFDRGHFYGQTGFEFALLTPIDGQPATPSNGGMIALQAPTRATVDEVHDLAIGLGGCCEGAPGIRGREESGFYGAYFRDLDGNKLCIYRVGPA
jgi:catechol 2,3-dioxygenase-like lactoylglutathione lyase family enzyme